MLDERRLTAVPSPGVVTYSYTFFHHSLLSLCERLLADVASAKNDHERRAAALAVIVLADTAIEVAVNVQIERTFYPQDLLRTRSDPQVILHRFAYEFIAGQRTVGERLRRLAELLDITVDWNTIDRIITERPGIGAAYLFPSPVDPSRPVTYERARTWLHRAEKLAKVPKQQGSLFHAYRRKWATERKHLPDVDVAAAGGWSSTETLKRCYQQADETTMLEVVLGAGELREKRA